MNEKQGKRHVILSGIQRQIFFFKRDFVVNDSWKNNLIAFPSVKTKRFDSLIKNHRIKNLQNHYNGISIKKILNRAEAVMAQFFTIFSVRQKKVVIRPKLNIR